MKLPAALLTSPVSGPSLQIVSTMASTAAASRMSTACVFTVPPYSRLSAPAVSSRTASRRPQIQIAAPSARYLAAISRPRPVPPPVTRMRLPAKRSWRNTGSGFMVGRSSADETGRPLLQEGGDAFAALVAVETLDEGVALRVEL